MRFSRRAFLATLAAAPRLPALEREPAEVYAQRRRALADSVGDGVIVLLGYGEHEGQSGYSSFRQESFFYYLSGHSEPGAALLIAPGKSRQPYREVVFLPEESEYVSKWLGPRLNADDPGALGFEEALATSRLPTELRSLLKDRRRLYGIHPKARPNRNQLAAGDLFERLAELSGRKDIRDVRGPLVKQRVIKSQGEVGLIRKAVKASLAAHRAAREVIAPGATEHEVMAAMVGAALSDGCERMAYPPIIGSGPNSTVLHYDVNGGVLKKGDLLLMDVGGEYSRYAADITRTVAVDGKMTAEQQRIYDLVQGAQQEAIKAVRPGASLNSREPGGLTAIAGDYFEKNGGSEIAAKFTHGLGHHVGLDVHDPSPSEDKLQPGMVITIEPGLYLREKGYGVRIEDMVLVTKDGHEVLSRRNPG